MARRRSKPTPKKLREFLELLAGNGNVSVSAEACNLNRRELYRRRDDDAEFAEAWDAAMEEATDHLEAEARRRALEGWDEPVFWKGIESGVVRRYSDTLLIFLLKGSRPEKFRDRQQLEHTGPGGEPLPEPRVVNVYIPHNGRDEKPE